MAGRHTFGFLMVFAGLALLGCERGSEGPSTEAAAPSSTPTVIADAEAASAPTPKPANRPPAPAQPNSPKMAPAPGTVRGNTGLRANPSVSAAVLRRLSNGSAVIILDRQGGWLQVKSGNQIGWVRLLEISTEPPGTHGTTTKELESAAKIATGRSGGGNVVATTGIRGLNEAQLRTATPNPEELKQLESYGVSKEKAAQYASAHHLTPRKVPRLAGSG